MVSPEQSRLVKSLWSLRYYQLALFLSAVLFALVAASWRAFLQIAGPRVRCTPSSIDVGSATTGATIDVDITVDNVGWLPLTVYELIPDCACWRAATMERWEIPGGDKAQLHATVDLTGMRGNVGKSLVVHSNAIGAQFHEIKLEAIVDSAVRLSPPDIHFAAPGDASIINVEAASASRSFRLLRCRARPSGCCDVAVVERPKGTYEVHVTCKDLRRGPSRGRIGTVELTTDSPGEEHISVPILLD